MATTSQRTIIVNEDDDVKTSVTTRGTKGALAIELLDASGTQITNFGGGTQYTEGDIDASITGTAILWEDTGNTLRSISATFPLPVDITDSTLAVTQSGTWDINTVTEVLGGTINIQDGGGSITVDGTVELGGYDSIGDGTAVVASAGTPVQLSAQACKRVWIQSHETNTGVIAVGTSTVDATSGSRRGLTLYATQGQWFNVNNLDLLYIDATVNGESIHYLYEN